jgi:hypothetical protein
MSEKEDTRMEQQHDGELEYYGDPRIYSADAPVPTWLKWFYVLLPIWGIFSLWFFWNGTHGWLDRGYWHQLQIAANTTFPSENMDNPQNADPKGPK